MVEGLGFESRVKGIGFRAGIRVCDRVSDRDSSLGTGMD
jgi:hypothetical protein